MTALPPLPPNWTIDLTLEGVIPPPHDYRTFKRVTENTERYAVCVVSGDVYNIRRKCFLKSRPNGKNPRLRYELNKGPDTKPFHIFRSRLVCTAAYGTAPTRKHQAHHKDRNKTNDTWLNLSWQTAKQNREIEAEYQAAKRRAGETNGRAVMDRRALTDFIREYDRRDRARLPINLPELAGIFNVTVRQLQRIVAGHSRPEEVAEIRRTIERRDAARRTADSCPDDYTP